MRFEIGGINRDCLAIGFRSGPSRHNPRKDTDTVPTLLAVAQRLRWATQSQCDMPEQHIAINEYSST